MSYAKLVKGVKGRTDGLLNEMEKAKAEIDQRPDLPEFVEEDVYQAIDKGLAETPIAAYAQLHREKLGQWRESDKLTRDNLGDHISKALWAGPRSRGEGPDND